MALNSDSPHAKGDRYGLRFLVAIEYRFLIQLLFLFWQGKLADWGFLKLFDHLLMLIDFIISSWFRANQVRMQHLRALSYVAKCRVVL